MLQKSVNETVIQAINRLKDDPVSVCLYYCN